MAPNVSQNINIGLPPKLKAPSNNMVTAILLVVVCGLFSWFVVLPKKAEVDKKESALKDITDQQGKIGDDFGAFSKLITDLKSHPDEIKQLDLAMPMDSKTFEFQLFFENFVKSAGVTVDTLSVSGPTSGVLAGDVALLKNPYGPTRTLKKFGVSVSVLGSFSQLKSFLQKIESSSRIMDINSLEIASDKNNNLGLKLGITAYYLAP